MAGEGCGQGFRGYDQRTGLVSLHTAESAVKKAPRSSGYRLAKQPIASHHARLYDVGLEIELRQS
jgi:hypothetical protein